METRQHKEFHYGSLSDVYLSCCHGDSDKQEDSSSGSELLRLVYWQTFATLFLFVFFVFFYTKIFHIYVLGQEMLVFYDIYT